MVFGFKIKESFFETLNFGNQNKVFSFQKAIKLRNRKGDTAVNFTFLGELFGYEVGGNYQFSNGYKIDFGADLVG